MDGLKLFKRILPIVELTPQNKATDKGSIPARPAVTRIASDGMGVTLDSKIIPIRMPWGPSSVMSESTILPRYGNGSVFLRVSTIFR